MYRSQAGLVRLDLRAEGKFVHAGKVLVGIATSNELFDLELPEPPTQLAAQGGFNYRCSAGITARGYQSIKFTDQFVGQAHRYLGSQDWMIPNWDAILTSCVYQVVPIMHIMSFRNRGWRVHPPPLAFLNLQLNICHFSMKLQAIP